MVKKVYMNQDINKYVYLLCPSGDYTYTVDD